MLGLMSMMSMVLLALFIWSGCYGPFGCLMLIFVGLTILVAFTNYKKEKEK